MTEIEPMNSLEGKNFIVQWLNRPMCIKLTDGRKVVGTFLCTDNDCNIILGQTREYWSPSIDDEKEKETNSLKKEEKDEAQTEEPRLLGLTMVPGRHIVSISVNMIGGNNASNFEYRQPDYSSSE